jgi:hypothetical protein
LRMHLYVGTPIHLLTFILFQLYTSNYRNTTDSLTAAGAGKQALRPRRGSPIKPPAPYRLNLELSPGPLTVEASICTDAIAAGDRSGGRVGSHPRLICRPSRNLMSYNPKRNLIVPKEGACCPWHDSIIRRCTCGERTAGWNLHLRSELQRHRGREGRKSKKCVVTCVETAGTFPQYQFPDLPVGLRKGSSTVGFGRRALKISPICRPAPNNREENSKFAGQIPPPSVVHQALRHPRLMSSAVDVKIPVQTSRGDKQGGPENLRRKFASNGSSPSPLH